MPSLLLVSALIALIVACPTAPAVPACAKNGDGTQPACLHCLDRRALDDIFNSLGSTGWSIPISRSGWSLQLNGAGDYVSDPCNGKTASWFGIQCAIRSATNSPGYVYVAPGGTQPNSAWRVTSIDLGDNNLVGNLPASIFQMSELTYLWLNGNPGLTGTLPVTVGNLLKLIQFKINGCGLTGPLPSEFKNLKGLTVLWVQNNRLSGSIPNLLGADSLADWRLGGNALVSTLPGYIPDLPALVKFDVSNCGNGLTGPVPTAWSNGRSVLRDLDISGNRLSGVLPTELAKIGQERQPPLGLQRFYFQNNRFTCVFPSFLGNVSRGILFNSSGNSFFCPLPDGISASLPNNIVSPCLQADIATMTLNGKTKGMPDYGTCTRGSPCLLSLTGTNFEANACDLRLAINSAQSDGQVPPSITLRTEAARFTQAASSTSLTFDLAKEAGSTEDSWPGVTAGSKQLSLSFSLPDGSLFQFAVGQLPDPVILLGTCQADCNGHGQCNPLNEKCICESGYFGADCSRTCEAPFITEDCSLGPTNCTYTECTQRGSCAYSQLLGRSVCTCNLNPLDGTPLWDGLYCERPNCAVVNCNDGKCDQATGKCVCTESKYVQVNTSTTAASNVGCDSKSVLLDWCGAEADEERDLPAGRGVFAYDLANAKYNCTCTEDEWEPDVGCLENEFCLDDQLNCDKEVPPTWPIILGCVLAGLFLCAIGIFVFLKIKKFDPEKKRQQMEMQALS